MASRVGIAKLLWRYKETGTIFSCLGLGRPTLIKSEMKAIVEAKMREDDETTVEQLHSLLAFRGFHISKKTVFHCRADLGWTFRGSTYCQLRAPNKLKRLQWVKVYIQDSFEDVIWTDECSVQLEAHKRFCCRKQGDQSQGDHFIFT